MRITSLSKPARNEALVAAWRDGRPMRRLVAEFGVSSSRIRQILRRDLRLASLARPKRPGAAAPMADPA